MVLVVRIATHNDKGHRQANPSLHYHIWDSANELESVFVILAKHYITQNASPDDRFIFNFQEMWMACIFQTMTPKHLAEYLPDVISKDTPFMIFETLPIYPIAPTISILCFGIAI